VLQLTAGVQLDQMAHALHETEARAAAAEASGQQALMDVACLKRGLELAAEQLTKCAGAEVPGTLLRAVARVSRPAGILRQEAEYGWLAGHAVAALLVPCLPANK
jgi:hypothetical protein